ncbi:hypothetical protein K9M09_00515 [Patescibacteria group bacterium]|nr:hypothetical protein [Patescibacteria group bacterium]
MGFENNVYGAVHPENSYNQENEERDRQNLQRENKKNSPKGNEEPFVSIKEVVDEDAESAIYENVEASIEKNKDEFEFDKFGFVSVLNDYFDKVADDKKEELFKNVNEFLVEYRAILDNEQDERTALKKANKAFYKIIGEEVTGYDAETGKIYFNLEKAKFIKVRDKKAPINAIKVEYDKYGKPVDPNRTPTEKMMEERRKKTKPAKTGLKMPWRR